MKKVNCPKCGGSGKTEHTHILYGVCFLCKGNGIVSHSVVILSEEKKQAKADAKILKAQMQKDKMIKELKLIKEVEHKNYLTSLRIQNLESSILFYNDLLDTKKLNTELEKKIKDLLKTDELKLNEEKNNIINNCNEFRN